MGVGELITKGRWAKVIPAVSILKKNSLVHITDYKEDPKQLEDFWTLQHGPKYGRGEENTEQGEDFRALQIHV